MSDAKTSSQRLAPTYSYFTGLTLLVYLVAPNSYLVDISTSYMLKNQLHAGAMQVSIFRLLTAAPLYVAFLFGFVRDNWSPFGLRDRGYMLIFGPAMAAVFLWMAFTPVSYWQLFVGLLLVMALSRFLAASYQGLMALVGQERLASGRLAALWQAVSCIPVLGGAFLSGWVTEHLAPWQTFSILAAACAAIGAYGLLRPRSVFDHAYDQPLARSTSLVGDFKRLLGHKAIYPAVLLIFMFQFAPGSNTPLQYYLTNTLHASDSVYANFITCFVSAFIPVYMLYGWLCKRVRFGKLLFWGIIITIPQMIPLAFIKSPEAALWLAWPIGAMGGIFAAAMYDLAMRSCPPGLQGTLMMLVEAGNLISTRGGDIVGSWIYNLSPQNGFVYCVIAITIVYALMLPVMLLIPKSILATADGERNPELEAEVLREVAET